MAGNSSASGAGPGAGNGAPVGVAAPLPERVGIRDALEDDLPGLLAIYNEIIANSTAVFSDVPTTLEERRAWWHGRLAAGYPVLVAVDDSGVLGFSTFGDFRAWPGYRFTAEHSVHVRADSRGRGVGTALVEALLPRAAAVGKRTLIAGIDADNLGSIRLHERLGFVTAGRLDAVGFKFDRWLDLVFLQKHLQAR